MSSFSLVFFFDLLCLRNVGAVRELIVVFHTKINTVEKEPREARHDVLSCDL